MSIYRLRDVPHSNLLLNDLLEIIGRHLNCIPDDCEILEPLKETLEEWDLIEETPEYKGGIVGG